MSFYGLELSVEQFWRLGEGARLNNFFVSNSKQEVINYLVEFFKEEFFFALYGMKIKLMISDGVKIDLHPFITIKSQEVTIYFRGKNAIVADSLGVIADEDIDDRVNDVNESWSVEVDSRGIPDIVPLDEDFIDSELIEKVFGVSEAEYGLNEFD